jgi:hypothetical protein
MGRKRLPRSAGQEAKRILSPPTFKTHRARVAKRAVELGNGHVDILVDNAGIYGARVLTQKSANLPS